MTRPRVYADFQNIDDANRLRLTCAGTLQDLARHGLQWHEGLVLTFYSDDADDHGQPDALRVEGIVHYDPDGLGLVPYAATHAWRYWLNRRGGWKKTWRAFGRMMAAYPLPRPKIVKGWVECRVCPWEPKPSG